MNGHRAVALLGLLAVLGAGCASSHDLTRDLPGIKFLKYTFACAAYEQRAALERGLTQLHAGEYESAVRSLHQAIWDVELIDKPSLRLEELVEAHEGLAEAYAALGKKQWSEEQLTLAQALVEYRRRASGSVSPDAALAKARTAYQAAQFREAVTAFGQALVELEGVSPMPVRVKALADARCHLMLAYFALGRPDRAAEEIRRLAGSNGATLACSRQAPPPVRTLIRSVETNEARSGKRSAD